MLFFCLPHWEFTICSLFSSLSHFHSRFRVLVMSSYRLYFFRQYLNAHHSKILRAETDTKGFPPERLESQSALCFLQCLFSVVSLHSQQDSLGQSGGDVFSATPGIYVLFFGAIWGCWNLAFLWDSKIRRWQKKSGPCGDYILLFTSLWELRPSQTQRLCSGTTMVLERPYWNVFRGQWAHMDEMQGRPRDSSLTYLLRTRPLWFLTYLFQ